MATEDDDTTSTGTGQADGDAGTVEPRDDGPTDPPAAQQSAQQQPVPSPRPAPPADDWKPPTREEWEKVTGSLRDASGESAARKKKLREMEQKLADLEAANATAEERAALELKKRVLQEAEAQWRPRVVAAEARSALAAAGCKDPGRWAKLIDLSKVEIDGDGSITGVDEQVAAVKADYPEAFKRERTAPPEPQAAQPGSTRVPEKKRTATHRQAAALLGKS